MSKEIIVKISKILGYIVEKEYSDHLGPAANISRIRNTMRIVSDIEISVSEVQAAIEHYIEQLQRHRDSKIGKGLLRYKDNRLITGKCGVCGEDATSYQRVTIQCLEDGCKAACYS